VLGQGRSYHVAGRLADGVGFDAAVAEMRALAGDLARTHPEENEEWTTRSEPYGKLIVGDVAPALWLLLGLTGLTLLIGCTNVATLCLNRVLDRRSEIATRRALGASSSSVVRLVLRESLVLAGARGSLGLLLAHGLVVATRALEPGKLPAWPRWDWSPVFWPSRRRWSCSRHSSSAASRHGPRPARHPPEYSEATVRMEDR